MKKSELTLFQNIILYISIIILIFLFGFYIAKDFLL